MAKVRKFFRQKHEFLKNESVIEKIFEECRQNFLQKDTYLTFNNKEKFISEIDRFSKYSKHHWLDLRLLFKSRGNKEEIVELKQK